MVFSREVASRILAYRSAIETISDLRIRRLFRVALAATAVPVSNVVVSGKGRRYRGGWQQREMSPDQVDKLFLKSITQAFYDLRRFEARRCVEYAVLRGDARRLAKHVGQHDLAVFSPPYSNSFDYTDVYNVELWALGYLSGPEANVSLRQSTLRSHVQLVRDMSFESLPSASLKRTIAALAEVRPQLWSIHIPEMIGAYMADLAMVLRGLVSAYDQVVALMSLWETVAMRLLMLKWQRSWLSSLSHLAMSQAIRAL